MGIGGEVIDLLEMRREYQDTFMMSMIKLAVCVLIKHDV